MIKIIKNHSTAINIEDITKDNYKYYKRLLAIQKSDASAYEEKHAEKMYNELSIKEELVQYYADGDFKNYNIRVHGFKNSAYSIGAKALGDLAYEMEKMTAKSFPIEIEMMQKHLFGQYDRICRCYKEIVKK